MRFFLSSRQASKRDEGMGCARGWRMYNATAPARGPTKRKKVYLKVTASQGGKS